RRHGRDAGARALTPPPAWPGSRTACPDSGRACPGFGRRARGLGGLAPARALLLARAMELEPRLTDETRPLFEGFLRSEECAAAACGSTRWLLSFLDWLVTCELTLDELERSDLNAAICDGMGLTIEAAPEDPAAVARELHAFLRWAARAAGVASSPGYEACCAYLASPEAARDIGEWLTPVEIVFHGAPSYA